MCGDCERDLVLLCPRAGHPVCGRNRSAVRRDFSGSDMALSTAHLPAVSCVGDKVSRGMPQSWTPHRQCAVSSDKG